MDAPENLTIGALSLPEQRKLPAGRFRCIEREYVMRKAFVVGAAAAALAMLAGCAYDDHPAAIRYTVAAGYGAPIYGAPIFYDGYYGPYWDGYWGPGGEFWFSPGPGRPFRRDLAGHFRASGGRGFNRVAVARLRRGERG